MYLPSSPFSFSPSSGPLEDFFLFRFPFAMLATCISPITIHEVANIPLYKPTAGACSYDPRTLVPRTIPQDIRGVYWFVVRKKTLQGLCTELRDFLWRHVSLITQLRNAVGEGVTEKLATIPHSQRGRSARGRVKIFLSPAKMPRALQFVVLVLAVPLQYLICQWTAPSASEREQLIKQ